jgi:hypothetical protein
MEMIHKWPVFQMKGKDTLQVLLCCGWYEVNCSASLNIQCSFIIQLNAQFSIHEQHICYTIIFDMFRALTCPSSGGNIAFTQHLISSLSVNGCTVESRLSLLSTGVLVQPFTESDDTRCCVNAIFPPEDGHVNARNMSSIIG